MPADPLSPRRDDGRPPAEPRVDHVVIDVGEGMEDAARLYRALGFHVTDAATHSLGTLNRLCVFASDYIEFLSVGTSGRADLASFPVGLNGLVFAMRNAAEFHDAQMRRGVSVQGVQSFGRPVDLPNGEVGDALFNVVRLQHRAVFDGRLYFCEHLTPELVWRPEWRVHANGALALVRVALAAAEPGAIADEFDRLFGDRRVERAASRDAPDVLRAATVDIEIWRQEAIASVLGAAMPERAGRADHVALLGVAVSSIGRTQEILRRNGIPHELRGADRLLAPPSVAMNVALEFVQARLEAADRAQGAFPAI